MRFSVIAGVLIFLSLFHTASAQLPSIVRKGQRITNNEGLSQGFIYSIYQDSYGFMWICTKDGLNRYDGYSFSVFRNDPNDPLSIASHEMHSIIEDKHHNLWINTINKGVDLFIRDLEIFIHFDADPNNPYRISDGLVYWITLVDDNSLWVCTSLGVDVITFTRKPLDEETARGMEPMERFRKEYEVSVSSYSGEMDGLLPSMHMYPDEEGLMIGIYNNQVYRGRTKSELELWTVPNSNYGLDTTGRHIDFVVSDTINKRLFFVSDNGIFRYNEKEKKSDFIPARLKRMLSPRSVHVDKKGNLWAVFEGVVHCLEANSNTIKEVTLDDQASPVAIGLGAMSFAVDRSGIWWIGTPGYGLLKYNPRIELLNHSRGKNNLSRSFYSIGEGEENIALVAGGYVFWQYDMENNVLGEPLKVTSPDQPSYEGYLTGHVIVKDATGNHWLADGINLYYIDRIKNETTLRYVGEGGTYDLISPMLLDKDGVLWFGSADDLICIQPGKEPESFQLPIEFQTGTDRRFVHALLDDKDKIWLGTVAGILSFTKMDHQWTVLPGKEQRNLADQYRVFSLGDDPQFPDKYLWAGLNGGGLCRVDKTSGELKKFTTNDGLPNDVIYGMLNDEQGNIWVSSNHGIACLHPLYSNEGAIAQLVRHLTSEDGLQSNEFNRYCYFKSKNGKFLFGGVEGLNCFDPSDLLVNTQAPGIVITDIRLKNKSLPFGHKTDILSSSPVSTNEIILDHDQDMITIQYAALDFANSMRNRFRYRMQGLSDEWIDAGNAREATFTNLDPGDYTFTVTGCDSDGVWNETGRSIRIIVLPAWWQTWWFRTLVMIGFLSIVYFIYNYRINQLKKIQLVRDRIARDLHDEIGSTLSSISLYSDLVKEKTETGLPEISPIASRISESSHRLMDSMSDIVWAINPDNDEFINIVQRMRAVSAELTEAAGINLEFLAEKEIEHLKLDMEARRNFYLIFREALNNSIKYSSAENILISISKKEGKIYLKIKDNGSGFDINDPRSGNGLINMRKRAGFLGGSLDIISEKGKGTCIVLSFKA